MATLERPGVNIKQSITAASPTVLTPTLVPCIVGPCYQIVEPLSGGALNPEALITTAAVLDADAPLIGTADMSGRQLKLVINGTLETVQFPVVGNGGGFSQALIVNTLNAGLSAAYAEYGDDDVLRISTYVKGASASISVQNVTDDVANTAAANLSFTTTRVVAGKAQYDNLVYEVPYASLPSPMTDVSNVVVSGSELSAYKYFGNILADLSQTRAINWTSYIPKEAITAAPTMSTSLSQWLPVPLRALTTTGSKTNKVQNWGTQASVTVPLHHTIGSGSVLWPDATGQNFLKVTANRINPITGSAGALVGLAGNGLIVDVVANGGVAQVTLGWAGSTMTIQNLDNTTTFQQLSDAIDAFKVLPGPKADITIELSFDAGAAGDIAMAHLGVKAFTAFGGTNPDNFAVDASTIADAEFASITGSVKVGAGTTADDLGIGGMVLSVSVDGGPWLDITLDGGTAIAAQINTASIAGLGFAIAGTQVVTLPHTATNVEVLQLSTLAGAGLAGADSTIEVKANNPRVLEQLFSGFTTRTDSIAAGVLLDANAFGGGSGFARKAVFDAVTDYNTMATALEKAVQPGSVTLQMSDLRVNAFIAVTPTPTSFPYSTVGQNLVITHNGVPATLNLALGATPVADVAALADLIAVELTGSALVALVKVGVVGDQLVFSAVGAAGTTLELTSVGTTAGALSIKQLLEGSPASVVFDVVATTIDTGVVTISDSTTGVWSVTSVGPSTLTSSLSFPSMPSSSSALTALLLDPACDFCYSSGSSEQSVTEAGSITFLGATEDPAGAFLTVDTARPLVIESIAATTADITYSRAKVNALGAFAGSGQFSPLLYGGRIFMARANRIEIGDTLYEAGTVKGKVMAFESVAPFVNNVLVLSDFTVDNGSSLSQWYCVAENLTSVSTRISPELTVDDVAQTMTVKHALNRNIAGIATPSRSLAPMYAGYRALRTDVSAAATNPALLAFADMDEVESVIGPVTPENPLAFALRTAFLHRTDIVVAALGIGETSADAPNGTVDSYIQALDFLALKEVYALAPLTHDKAVHDVFASHVTAMSDETGRKERVVFVSLALPTEKAPASAATGLMKIGAAYGPNSTKYDLTFQGDNPPDAKTAIGANRNAGGTSLLGLEAFTAADGVYLEREGDAYKYLVVGVSSDGTVITIDVDDLYGPGGGPASGGNSDAYFRTTAPANFEADGEQCGVWVRQAAIDSTTTAGKLQICETLAELTGGVTGYQNKRMFFSQPEQLGIDYDGSEVLVPGFHACVADVARSGQLSPSQPFTNLPYNGFTRVIGSSDKFSENQMATAAAGGVWWVVQDVPGGSLVCRHQLSTDTSTLKLREYSITRAVDYVAKVIRAQTRRFIGRNNITKSLLDMLGLSLNAALNSVIGSVVKGASIDLIEQNASNPDNIDVTVTVSVFYPCNKITITIVA